MLGLGLIRLRGRLIAVQLSDRIRDFVDHVLPGEGFIDWGAVCEQLRLARFDRPLLLEVSTTTAAIKAESDNTQPRRTHAVFCSARMTRQSRCFAPADRRGNGRRVSPATAPLSYPSRTDATKADLPAL